MRIGLSVLYAGRVEFPFGNEDDPMMWNILSKPFLLAILLFLLGRSVSLADECQLFAATGNVTQESITILAKVRDLYSHKEQRIWYSPRATHDPGDSIHFRKISIPQCSLTYKFIATNSYVKDQTTGYGINEYGLAMISHDMDSWDDDSLGTEYFYDQDYVALALARCRTTAEAIDLFEELIIPQGINAETYLMADSSGLWLFETSGHNFVAKPIGDDVVSSKSKRYNIRTEWSDPGNRYNPDILENAAAHGCDTTNLDFAVCFSNLPPGVTDKDLAALKDSGNITVADMRELLRDKAYSATASACVIPIRPGKDLRFFGLMWDSRADPEYGNVYLPFWMAISDSALPYHYTSWPPEDGDCAWKKFSQITTDSILYTPAEPIWQAWQVGLDTSSAAVETIMENYLCVGDTVGMRSYIDGYLYAVLDSAYDQAVDIIEKAGVPLAVADLSAGKAGENLMLQWSAVTVDRLGNPVTVDGYYVFREKDILSKSGVQPFDTVAACWYLDTTGVIGDPIKVYRYWLAAVAGWRQSQFSEQVGAFDLSLTAEK